MIDITKIQNYLKSCFIIGFDVKSKDINSFHLAPTGADGTLFSLDISYTDVRLKISAEPQKYAANFVDILSQSGEERRRCFISIWNEIGNKGLTVLINDSAVSKDEFLNFDKKWKHFCIILNKAPYYNIDEDESQDNCILHYIQLICDLFLTLFPYEIQGADSEGTETKVTVSKYERHPHNRDICLRLHGYKCAVCGFDFESVYGEIGRKYIEVHHIKPVCKFDGSEHFDPTKDLVPLCSNCHSMAHRRKENPYSVQELKSFIEQNKHS